MKLFKFGGPVNPAHRPNLGIRFIDKDDQMANKAPDNGIYELNGKRFRATKGKAMPTGATFEKAEVKRDPTVPQDSERAQKGPPQNKAQQGPSQTKEA